jgi:hypothetical protein
MLIKISFMAEITDADGFDSRHPPRQKAQVGG